MNETQGTEEKAQDAGERESRVDVPEEVGVSQERTTGPLAFLSIPSARARTLEPGCLQRMRPWPRSAPSLASLADRGGERGTAVSHRPLSSSGSRKGPWGRKRKSVARPVASHPRRPHPSRCGKSGRGRNCSLWSGRARPRRSAAAGGRDASAAALGRGAGAGGAGRRRRRR